MVTKMYKFIAFYPTIGSAKRLNKVTNNNFSPLQYPQLFQAKPPDHDKESAMRKTFDYLNRQLQGQKYMAGDEMTLADISMATNLALLELRNYKLDQWALMNAWYQRMKQLPYWGECNAGLYEWKNPMLSDFNA